MFMEIYTKIKYLVNGNFILNIFHKGKENYFIYEKFHSDS